MSARTRRRRRQRAARRNRANNRGVVNSFAPTAYATTVRNSGAMNSWTLSHREFIQDLLSDGTGTRQYNLSVNPGLDEVFPWLSQIAMHFETYTFTKLNFVFVPVLAATKTGSVAICPDYDAADTDSSHSKSELLSFQDSVRSNIWSRVTMTCRPSNLTKFKQRYCRDEDPPASTDIKTYDVAQLIVLLNDDLASGDQLGELWVEYTITLYTPQLNHYDGSADFSTTGKVVGTYPAAADLTWITKKESFTETYPDNSLYGNLIRSKQLILSNLPLSEKKGNSMESSFQITRPGVYLFTLFAGLISDPGSLSWVYDSDTGDCDIVPYRNAYESANGNYMACAKISAGKLTSTGNPVNVQLVWTPGSLIDVDNFVRWFLTRLNGFSLPSAPSATKTLERRGDCPKDSVVTKRVAKAPEPSESDELVMVPAKLLGEIGLSCAKPSKS